jgi:hypothetical protein
MNTQSSPGAMYVLSMWLVHWSKVTLPQVLCRNLREFP